MTAGDILPSVGDIITSEGTSKSYSLITALGEGGYGTVFEALCLNTNRRVALKAEKYSKTVLRIEAAVLKAASSRKCAHICELLDCGTKKPDFMYIVMTLLGPDLNRLRNQQIDRHFNVSTAVRVAMQSMNAIEELHQCGFLSRDVKPGNFAIGSRETHNHRIIYIFDFGLARKYLDKNRNVVPSRGEMGWRGTTRYGSLNAHRKQDLGRRDDAESWLYMVVEITRGCLPWRMVTDREIVKRLKEEVRTTNRETFFQLCPDQYSEILNIIDCLHFPDEPPYLEFYRLLEEAEKEYNVTRSMKYDWEMTDESDSSSLSQSFDQSPPKSQNAEREEIGRPKRTQ